MATPVSEWLEEEVEGLAEEGIRRVVSLLEAHEMYELGLQRAADLCISSGIEFISYPIPDRGVPASVASFRELTKYTYHESVGGKNTVVHCRTGIGCSGVVAEGVLLHCGFDVSEVFPDISKACRVKVLDTPQKESWLHDYSRSIAVGI